MREDILQALSELIKEKTKLKAEKIELGMVDDIEKLINSYEQDRKKLDNKIDTFYNKIIAVNKSFPEISKIYTNFDKTIKSLKDKLNLLEKQAKELGVNANDIPALKDGNSAINRADDIISEFFEANRIAKKIKASF